MTHTPIIENFKSVPKLAGQNRIRLVSIIFSAFFLMIAVQLGKLTLLHKADTGGPEIALHDKAMPRPDIVDRNGEVLATDIEVASLFADHERLVMLMKL